MSIVVNKIEKRAKAAVKHFWSSRTDATSRQEISGLLDRGGRSAVTAGKNMDGFVDLVKEIVISNGISEIDIVTSSRLTTLPGFFRPTKNWDLLVVSKGQLIAAFEFKSQVGPSFGNNFNNRCEEAMGTATDLWTAFREGAFKESSKPFVGYLMLLEDCEASRQPVNVGSPSFPVFDEFLNTSYADRYALLCRKMVLEKLYDSATLLVSRADRGIKGAYSEPDEMCNLMRMVTGLAGHVAATAALLRSE